MYSNIIILQSKLVPPRLSGTVDRVRLNGLLAQIANARLVAITAGAGYGKTTFAAQACHNLKRRAVWYRLDPSDMDVIVFIHYLIAGIRRHCPEFGHKTMARIQSVEQLRSEERAIWTVFVHELESVIQIPITIVLDDFHNVQPDSGIRCAMGFLLEHLPETVQLLVISRKTPELDLSRLVAGRKAFELSEQTLAFTPPETGILYQEIFALDLGHETVEALAAKTGGWAAGLILFQYNMKDKSAEAIAAQLAFLDGSHRAFGRYLEENIIQTLPADLKSFLFKTAILSQLEVVFCNQLLGIDNAAELLQQLEHQHLFTFSLDGQLDSYQYHHLFRDYLRSKLTSVLDPDSVKQLHMKAARIWERLDVAHEAAAHYLAAEAFKQAGDLLVKHGIDMIMAGRLNQVLEFLDKIPENECENAPWLTFFTGNVLLYQGKTSEALTAIEKARSQFTDMGDQSGIGLCLSRLATGYYLRRDFVKAEAIYKEILPRVADDPEFYTYCLGSLIFVISRLGKFQEADRYFQEAETFIAQGRAPSITSWIYTTYGFRLLAGEDYINAIQYGKKAARLAQRDKQRNTYAACLHLIAYCRIELDEDDKALAASLEGMAVCERYGTMGATYAWCCIDAGKATAKMGDLQKALEYSREGLRISRETESDWTEAWATINLAFCKAQMRDMDGAEIYMRQAVGVIRRTTLVLEIAVMESLLAWILLKKGCIEEAMPLIPVLDNLPFKSSKLTCWTHILLAFVDCRRGRRKAAKEKLHTALGGLTAVMVSPMMIDDEGWMLPLLAELYIEGAHKEKILYCLSLLEPEQLIKLRFFHQKMNGKERRAFLPLMHALGMRDTKDLSVQCFGQFMLQRDEKKIPSSRWVSAKARQLFKYLVFNAGKGYVAKDRLLELLWPDQDPAVTGKRLHVALTTIRKVLEPELARGEKSIYLLRENDAYQLYLGDNGYLDIAAFDRALRCAEEAEDQAQALEYLLTAEQCYKGDLFQEETYTEWCIPARTSYREKYFILLRKIADYYEKDGRPTECIDYLIKALNVDEYEESIYCRLMSLYRETGNRFMAVKTYERCKERLEKELQCPLSEETQSLYQEIVSA